MGPWPAAAARTVHVELPIVSALPTARVRERRLGLVASLDQDATVTGLAAKDCVPCRGGVPPLTTDQIEPLLSQLDGWQVIDNHHLTAEYTFPDFVTALERVNRVGQLAEQQGHHPDIYLTWGKVRIDIWTHKIDGLTKSDFVLAAKLDELGST